MKNLLFVIIALIISLEVSAQSILTKDSPESGNIDNVASEQVIFLPGYEYSPEGGNQMRAYIDATATVGPPNYSPMPTDEDFDNQEINTNLAVGLTPSAANVSSSGAATYAIPIQLPKGTNGMEPELAITYSSQGGNNILGYGWSLSGLSMIMRGGKNFYANEKTEAIQMDETDNLYFDGNRLINIGSNEYRTEAEHLPVLQLMELPETDHNGLK
jgi:hypothetical protein